MEWSLNGMVLKWNRSSVVHSLLCPNIILLLEVKRKEIGIQYANDNTVHKTLYIQREHRCHVLYLIPAKRPPSIITISSPHINPPPPPKKKYILRFTLFLSLEHILTRQTRLIALSLYLYTCRKYLLYISIYIYTYNNKMYIASSYQQAVAYLIDIMLTTKIQIDTQKGTCSVQKGTY